MKCIRRYVRDLLEEKRREIDECGMEEFGTLDISEKTIAILGDRWWPQGAKQEGDKISNTSYAICGNHVRAPNCWRCLY